MELNQECLDKAVKACMACLGSPENCIAAAIKAYLLADLLKPGQVTELPLEAAPQRDYRKELWIDVATAVARSDATTSIAAPANWANSVIAEFDATFPPEKAHG